VNMNKLGPNLSFNADGPRVGVTRAAAGGRLASIR